MFISKLLFKLDAIYRLKVGFLTPEVIYLLSLYKLLPITIIQIPHQKCVVNAICFSDLALSKKKYSLGPTKTEYTI